MHICILMLHTADTYLLVLFYWSNCLLYSLCLKKKMDWTEFHMSCFYCKMKKKIFKSLFSHLIYRFMDLILSACDSSEIRGFMLTEIVQAKLLQNLTYILFWEYKKTQIVFLHFWILDIKHKPIISEVWCTRYLYKIYYSWRNRNQLKASSTTYSSWNFSAKG